MRAWPVARSIFDAPFDAPFDAYPTCCPLVRFSHIGSIKDAARDGSLVDYRLIFRFTLVCDRFVVKVV